MRRLYGDGGAPQQALAELGLPETLAASFTEASPCEIWQCNWKTVQMFNALGTQWRVGMGGAIGLDYNVIAAVARGLRIKLTPERFAGIQIMEAEALRVMGERREQSSRQ